MAQWADPPAAKESYPMDVRLIRYTSETDRWYVNKPSLRLQEENNAKRGAQSARLTIAQPRGDAAFELVNIKDFNLPLLDEPVPPSIGQYSQPHPKAWAAKIEAFDADVFVTPEYNHGTSGTLKNALEFVYREWNNQVAGFLSRKIGQRCA